MSDKSQFAELDEAILRYLREAPVGSRYRHPIYVTAILEAARKCLPQGAECWRLIDRRLQALKKRGVIKYSKGFRRWVIA